LIPEFFWKSADKIWSFVWNLSRTMGTVHAEQCALIIKLLWIFFVTWNISDKTVEKIKTHFMFNNFFPWNRAVYEIMLRNVVQSGRPKMCIAFWVPKATGTHSEYVILIAFPRQ
jgi:hypothetical protein